METGWVLKIDPTVLGIECATVSGLRDDGGDGFAVRTRVVGSAGSPAGQRPGKG